MSETRLPGKLNQPRSPKIACERYTLQYSTRAELIIVSFLLDRILIYATERCSGKVKGRMKMHSPLHASIRLRGEYKVESCG